MKLYQKITVGFFGSFVLLGGLGLYFLHNNYQLQSRNKKAFEQARIESETVANLSQSLYLIQAYARELIFLAETNGDRAEIKQYNQKIKIQLRNVDDNVIKGVKTTLLETKTIIYQNSEDLESQAADLGTIKQIDREIIQYKQNINQFLYMLSQGKTKEAKNFYRKYLSEKVQTTIMPLIEEYKNHSLQDIKNSEELISERANTYFKTVKSYLMLGWLISLVWFIYIYYAIYSPLNKIEDNLAWQQAKGILNKNIEPQTETKNELKNLIDVFNSLVEQLKQTKNSNVYLEKLIGAIDDSLIVINYDKEIEKVNQATSNLLGYEKKDLIGQKIHKILEKNTIFDIKDFIKQAGEVNYITKDNKKKTVAIKCALLENQNSNRDSIIFLAKDLTQQPKTIKALRENEQRYKLALETTKDGIFEWDLLTKTVNYSPRWCEILGYEESEIGKTLREWFARVGEDYKKTLKQKFVAYLKGKTSQLEVTYQIKHKDGHYLPALCRAKAIRDANGKIIRTILTQTDLSDIKKAEEELHYLANHDRLTGLQNREFLLKQLQKRLDKYTNEDSDLFAVISLNFNSFQSIEDNLGIAAGERLLIDIAARINNYLIDKNIIAKLRQGRFAIVVENIKDVREVILLAENIQREFRESFTIAEQNIFLTPQAGIAVARSDYQFSEQLLINAEIASERAKELTTNNIAVFESSMQTLAANNFKLKNDLIKAIDNYEFQVYYQPIVELKTNKIIGFEALTRWQHPEKGLIYEAEFMPLAIETGAISAITKQIVGQACVQMSQWQKQYFTSKEIFLSVNIGDLKFVPDNLLFAIEEILAKNSFSASNLQLKFTATASEEADLKIARAKLDRFKAKDFKVTSSNFARSYSSLGYLGSLPIDNLEFDRSLIADIENNKAKSAIIAAIINFAASLGLNIFAEGIDNVKQANFLVEKNCQYGRGAFFCGPVTNEVAEALIASQNSSLLDETSNKERGVTKQIT